MPARAPDLQLASDPDMHAEKRFLGIVGGGAEVNPKTTHLLAVMFAQVRGVVRAGVAAQWSVSSQRHAAKRDHAGGRGAAKYYRFGQTLAPFMEALFRLLNVKR
jgi:hypothetical protein